MSGKVVVSDGTDSFYSSRGIFQTLHDHGDFSSITAYSSSVADAKKMLLSRQARYSGLIDVLSFADGDVGEAFAGASTWISINSDAAALGTQLKTAKAAGITRVLLHFSSEGPSDGTSADGLAAELEGLTYTVLRTGNMVKGAGSGLVVGDLKEPTCADVPKEDVFRILTEGLTLESANGRMLSLCALEDTSQLKAMRQAGCSRREEADALFKGEIKEPEPVPVDTPEQVAAKAEEATKADTETELAQEEELKMLIAKARQRSVEEAEARAEKEEKEKKRLEEREEYFRNLPSEPSEPQNKGEDGDDKPPAPPSPPSPPPPKPPSNDGGDDDGLAVV